ncbi:MAG: hypothetical protein WDW38_007694 [Sanguina aurantia]
MGVPAMEKLFQISSPVPVGMYPLLATLLLTSGLLTTGGFFLYQVTKTRQNRSLGSEVMLACLASVLLGLGMLFMLLWSGVYV